MTAEKFYRKVFGVKGRGSPADRRFDRATGKGRVDPYGGDYADARRKGFKVVLWLIESSGGIDRGTLRYLNHLAKRITGAAGSDRTVYGSHPLSPKSYVPHHMQRLSAAAVVGAAKMVRGAANKLKYEIMGSAHSADAVGEHA